MIHMLLVFVDGLGWGADDPSVNPVACHAPALHAWILRHAKPVDACLGVPGLPQSATGQATLLTGINAAATVGRHVESFPGPALQEIVREHNVLKTFQAAGLPAAFANAYFLDEKSQRMIRNRPSVTTVATLSAFGAVRDAEAMRRGEAVYQDLTREHLRLRGYDGPLVTPAASARHLADIASRHAFTLFEYFQTDLAGHRGDEAGRKKTLNQLDEFWRELMPWAAEPLHLLLLASDHGNIEDVSATTHTMNPVPFGAEGEGAAGLRDDVRSLCDIAPALLQRAGIQGRFPAR